nr:L,D-transpeptidase [Arthrobacter sp. Hiyo1]
MLHDGLHAERGRRRHVPPGRGEGGRGAALQLTFSEPVVNKAAVEKAIKVTSTSGQVGAFHWFSDTMVRYRPENFWAANSTVTVDLKLFGVDFGNGQIGNFNKTNTFKIGDKKVAVADAVAHTFTVSINDQQVGQWPDTMGDTRFPSARGYLVLMEKYRVEHMDASTIGLKPGDPAYYGQLDVNYATRLTPSGEFIHQATDSALPYIGVTNLSHGCIGLGPDGAKWVFDNMTTGDVVQVVNTRVTTPTTTTALATGTSRGPNTPTDPIRRLTQYAN